MAKNFAPDIPGHFKADDPRWNEIEALQKEFTSGGGRRVGGVRDAPVGDIAGRYFSGAPIGPQFGLGDISDRNRLNDDLGLMGYDTRGPLGLGKEDEMLRAVNELAAEWGMAEIGSLDEVSEEFLVKIESLAGLRR